MAMRYGIVMMALAAGAAALAWWPRAPAPVEVVRGGVAGSPFGAAGALPLPARIAAAPPSAIDPPPLDRLAASADPADAWRAFRLIERCRSAPAAAACRGVTPLHQLARLQLLDRAARAGVPGATTAWVEQGPFGDRSALDQRPDDPLVLDWVEQAIARVKAAARRDDIGAIAQLGLLSLYWELDEVGRAKVLLQHAAAPRDEPARP